MSTAKPVRLREIAEKAGVSRATVSLALRNHSSIPPKTRLRIQEEARQLGYRPNPLVSALMTYQRSTQPRETHLTLAVILNFSRHGPWQDFLSEGLLRNAAARAEQQGYRLEEFWLGDLNMTGQRLSTVLYRRNVPGIIVAPLPAPRGHLRFEWEHFAAVAIGASLLRPMLHRVTTDRFRAMRLAVRQLRRMHYRKLGLALRTNQDARVDHQWAASFLWEQEQAPASSRTVPFVVEERDWEEGKFVKWLKANQPEVILGYDPVLIEWLAKAGKRVPQDVGFVHLWNPDQSGRFAGIYHDPPAIGAAAVDFLVGIVQRNERGVPSAPQTLLLESVWQDGGTVRRRGSAT